MTELLETKLKRKRDKPTHRWTEEQTLLLLQAVADVVKDNPEGFEKPTSQKFYEKIIDNITALKPVTWICAKNKMRNLRATYVSANTWRMNTGSGLMENGDESTVRSHILKICPHYDLLGDIYGHKQSVAPCFILDTNEPMIISSEAIIINSDSSNEEHTEEIAQKSLNDVESETASSISFTRANTPIKRLKPEGKRRIKENKDPINKLLELQEKKIKIEMDKLEFEKEKEKNNIEVKKMELENERLKLESEERIRKLELQLKYQTST